MDIMMRLKLAGIKIYEPFNGFSLEEIVSAFTSKTLTRLTNIKDNRFLYDILYDATSRLNGRLDADLLNENINDIVDDYNKMAKLIKKYGVRR